MNEVRLTQSASVALAALAPIAVAALLVPLRDDVVSTNLALVLVILVVLGGVVAGRVGGALAAITAALSFDFFLTQPYLSLTIDKADDFETTILLLIVGLVVGQIAVRSQLYREAAARGRSEITRALFSDDTRYMQRALEALGVRVRADEAAQSFVVDGADGRFPASQAALDIGNAGTAARFLTAAVALGRGTFVIDGSPAMRKRPIQPLLDGLRALGVDRLVTEPEVERELSSHRAVPNVPKTGGRFVGRRKELEMLRSLLTSPGWITVTGPGGSGKTRLAQQVAPDRTVLSLDQFGCLCSTMFRVSPNHLLWILEGLVDGEVHNRIVVPENQKQWTKVALDRMLSIYD